MFCSKFKSILLSIALIVFCAVLFYYVYEKGVFLLYDGEKADVNNFFASYASLFGALITVFVALFTIQKWWDRNDFQKMESELKRIKHKNSTIQEKVVSKINQELLPKKVKEYVCNNKEEVIQPLKDMMVDRYGLYATYLHIEFLETLFDAQKSSLNGKPLYIFARKIFNLVVEKIKNGPHGKNFDLFEKSINLLLALTQEMLSEEFVIEDVDAFYGNLEYLHHEILVIKYDGESSKTIKLMDDKSISELETNVNKLYGKYISRPEESVIEEKK
ncbi:hypothetical protein [Fibrobacter sp. UBA2449]|uniref:hypothetical protein n=1 Tax=Fibrobacter sp. UBA2449 TaxID=1946529 RepID=UPI0025C4E456|nr:hypothetical protein [Fibrobacter sp. UBA2449]